MYIEHPRKSCNVYIFLFSWGILENYPKQRLRLFKPEIKKIKILSAGFLFPPDHEPLADFILQNGLKN